jgi:hypothetical protein
MLRAEDAPAELRERNVDGDINIQNVGRPPRETGEQLGFGTRRDRGQRDRNGNGGNGVRERVAPAAAPASSGSAQQRIYPFGISRDRLEKAIGSLRVPATIVRDMSEATMVMTLKNYYRQGSDRVRQAEGRGVPVYVLRNNTVTQMERQLADVFHVKLPDDEPVPAYRGGRQDEEETEARLEMEEAITQVLNGERNAVELAPRSNYIRKLQHQMAERYNVRSESRGREPHRRVKLSKG